MLTGGGMEMRACLLLPVVAVCLACSSAGPAPEDEAVPVEGAGGSAPDAAPTPAKDASRDVSPGSDGTTMPRTDAADGATQADAPAGWRELPVATVQDKIRGGLLGHIIGDLNGLAHENKYITDPGNVTSYAPSLPGGGWSDDDTDFEWVYVVAMQEQKQLLIPNADIPALWKAHINRYFWCSNQYARQLMDLGIVPPLTGQLPLNPWSDFNIAGQFESESFGMISPGLPNAAARTGLRYTEVVIHGEPAQATQLFGATIATAFTTDDMNVILDAGLAAVDPKSTIHQVVTDVRGWYAQNPNDWRATRTLLRDKYTKFGGATRDSNGYELNTGSIIGALLYGGGDYVQTSIHAFNFGWDADCNAATACAILGVLKGFDWLTSQGWDIGDGYANRTRDAMPTETITSFGDRLIALAEMQLAAGGGVRSGTVYKIPIEPPSNVEPLADPAAQLAQLSTDMKADVASGVTSGATVQDRARAAYLAIALDQAKDLMVSQPTAWAQAVADLTTFTKVVGVLFFEANTPEGAKLRTRAVAAGLTQPATRPTIW
jgi:hypothetical protein